MKKSSEVCGKEMVKVTDLPHLNSKEVLLHREMVELPTRYALTGTDFRTYILNESVFPQYQQP